MNRSTDTARRIVVFLGIVCLGFVACALLVVVLGYPRFVESRFDSMLQRLRTQGQVVVTNSTILGKPSDHIQLCPIIESSVTGEYPHSLHDRGSLERDYIRHAYWHGYWFNYSKHLKVGERNLLAYWSIRENGWHVGQFEGRQWTCLPEICTPDNHTRPPNRLRPGVGSEGQ